MSTASHGSVSKLQAEVRALTGSGTSSIATLEDVNRCEQQFPHGSGMWGIYSFVAESTVCRQSHYWVFAIDCPHRPGHLQHKGKNVLGEQIKSKPWEDVHL